MILKSNLILAARHNKAYYMNYTIWKLKKGIGNSYKLAEIVSDPFESFEQAEEIQERWIKDAIENELYDIYYIISVSKK